MVRKAPQRKFYPFPDFVIVRMTGKVIVSVTLAILAVDTLPAVSLHLGGA